MLTKKWLENTPKDQFLNLVGNFSGDSPVGRVNQLLEAPDKMLNNKQRNHKNQVTMWRAGIRGFS